MDNWPPKNGESSTTPESTDAGGQTSSEQPSNRVIMLLGLDPNTTSGMITKAFSEHGLQVTVDYQRDDTIGYVQLYLDIAKEVAERIMNNGGLRIGTDVAVLRALEGMEDLMYWSVYAGAHIMTSRSSSNCRTSGKVRHQRRHNRQNPYQIMELEDGVDFSPSSPSPTKYIKGHQRVAKSQRRKKRKLEKTLNKSALKKTKAKRRLSFMETEDSTPNVTSPFDNSPFDDDSPFDNSTSITQFPDVVLRNTNGTTLTTLTSPAYSYNNNKNNSGNNNNVIEKNKLTQLSTFTYSTNINANTINTINTININTINAIEINKSLSSSLSLSSFSVSNQIYPMIDQGETKSYSYGSLVKLPLCLRNKDEADEVEERLKNLHLNNVNSRVNG